MMNLEPYLIKTRPESYLSAFHSKKLIKKGSILRKYQNSQLRCTRSFMSGLLTQTWVWRPFWKTARKPQIYGKGMALRDAVFETGASIDNTNNKNHGLLPPGGLVSPLGWFALHAFDQAVPKNSQRHLGDRSAICILHRLDCAWLCSLISQYNVSHYLPPSILLRSVCFGWCVRSGAWRCLLVGKSR